MSRIGKVPIKIPAGTQASIAADNTITVKGPKGELFFKPHPLITVKITENEILVVNDNPNEKFQKSLHGLTRSLISNMVQGVNKEFEKKLEINGVGYKVQIQGKKMTFNLGYSHPIDVEIPQHINVEQDKEKKNILIISSTDKESVGRFAANIRKLRPPEPYKGKGIKYSDEHIIRKVGKAAAKVGSS